MLTEAQNYIKETDGPIAANGDVYLYGKEINDETYAICKSDMMIKGNNPENIKVGSTLATDEFSGQRFDFMLSNPPYGKSWKSDIKHIKDNDEVIDPRFRVQLTDYWGKEETVDATPRSSDGQLLFLMEMVAKMKPIANSPIGSRIASVHNGSSLFTGDAGSGESNIRRFIIENDMLDTIIQLPNNIFYNTGITTYIWLLSNAKPEARRGKVQLIDANLMFRKLRKNLGDKNCEFAPEHIEEITAAYLAFQPAERKLDEKDDPTGIAVKIFDNTDFGYHKVTIERPDRRRAQFSAERLEPLRFDKSLREPMEHLWAEHGDKVYQPGFLKGQAKAIQTWCEEQEIALNGKQRAKVVDTALWLRQRDLIGVGHELMQTVGTAESADFNAFRTQVSKSIKARKIKLTPTEKNAILNAVSWYADDAEKVIDSIRRFTKAELEAEAARLGSHIDELGDFGLHAQPDGSYLTYEASTDLRDSEAVPLKDSIHRYFKVEVKPHVPEAWINLDTVKIGYEISFNKFFYRHKPLRSLDAVTRDILALEQKADGLIAEILGVRQADMSEAA
jgi:type I restriction enzyme M protein